METVSSLAGRLALAPQTQTPYSYPRQGGLAALVPGGCHNENPILGPPTSFEASSQVSTAPPMNTPLREAVVACGRPAQSWQCTPACLPARPGVGCLRALPRGSHCSELRPPLFPLCQLQRASGWGGAVSEDDSDY